MSRDMKLISTEFADMQEEKQRDIAASQHRIRSLIEKNHQQFARQTNRMNHSQFACPVDAPLALQVATAGASEVE